MTMKQQLKRAAVAAVAAAAVALGLPAQAQQWPSKAVRIVVPFGAGGGTDIQGRLLGQKFQASLGQNFLVDNRPGAAGLIGAELVAKSPGDGYNILFTTASLAVNIPLYGKRVNFDPYNDLVPVSWISSVPLVLVVHPSVPAKNLKEFLALVKKSGRMNAAHNGTGTTSHLSIEMLKLFGGMNITPVPYKGGGPALVGQISGETDFTFATALAAQPFIKSGKVRPLAVTTAKPASIFPNLPTMKSVYPEFESDNWYAMFFSKGTPKDIVSKLNSEILKALKAPDVNEFIRREGGEPVGSTPEELMTYFKRESEKYAKVIKAANIRSD
ncbi:MAG: tripartite tricarboxylate transporter substrate binding protein [Burkholderiales bacterium]|nr:tripartite tricarboxylate transporter substrate binding protein [Burkholderiales bacterium]